MILEFCSASAADGRDLSSKLEWTLTRAIHHFSSFNRLLFLFSFLILSSYLLTRLLRDNNSDSTTTTTMAPSEDGVLVAAAAANKKRPASVSGSSTGSSDDSSRRKKRRDRKNGSSKKRSSNGDFSIPGAFAQRRNSLAKASRDPRDEPLPKKKRAVAEGAVVKTRSPSPVIDFDGLSRPSTFLLFPIIWFS